MDYSKSARKVQAIWQIADDKKCPDFLHKRKT